MTITKAMTSSLAVCLMLTAAMTGHAVETFKLACKNQTALLNNPTGALLNLEDVGVTLDIAGPSKGNMGATPAKNQLPTFSVYFAANGQAYAALLQKLKTGQAIPSCTVTETITNQTAKSQVTLQWTYDGVNVTDLSASKQGQAATMEATFTALTVNFAFSAQRLDFVGH